jgi:hypothetical protein
MKHRRTIFHAWVGPVWLRQKARYNTLRRTCVFASGGICGSRGAFWCVRSVKHRCTIFLCSGGPDVVSIKMRWDTLGRTCVFVSSGICGSHSAFLCVRAMKRRRTIFMLGWGWYGFDKKCIGTRYAELMFLHPVGSTGRIVHSGASGRETSTYYFLCLGGAGAVSIKMRRDTLQ